MSVDLRTAPTSSRIWSCSTLLDGVQHVSAEAKQLEEEELELQRQLQALLGQVVFCLWAFLGVCTYI